MSIVDKQTNDSKDESGGSYKHEDAKAIHPDDHKGQKASEAQSKEQ
jgi:hypothetical protein